VNEQIIIIVAVSKKLPLLEVNAGEALVALLSVQFASSFGCHSLCYGDSFTVILGINKVSFSTYWSFPLIIGDIHSQLHGFLTWTTMKTACSTKFRVHYLAK
jgi:hypothetical protein